MIRALVRAPYRAQPSRKLSLPADLTAIRIGLRTLFLVLSGMTMGVLGVGLPLVAVPTLSQIVSVLFAIMTLGSRPGRA